MQTSVSRNEFRTTGNQGIVYRTVCQNRGCGFNVRSQHNARKRKPSRRFNGMSALQKAWRPTQIPGTYRRKAFRGQAIFPGDRD